MKLIDTINRSAPVITEKKSMTRRDAVKDVPVPNHFSDDEDFQSHEEYIKMVREIDPDNNKKIVNWD